MPKSSSPWIVNDFNFGVPDSPRIRTHEIRDVESNVSPLRDLSFADTRMFPQAIVRYIETHHDLCEHYGLFPEYLPYVGLRQTIAPTDCPLIIKHIYSLCHQQLSASQEPTEIEV
jgi:hypothetical protein